MIANPDARKLFRRVILQSGGFGRAPLSQHEAAQIGRDFLRFLAIDPKAPDAAASMRQMPVAALIAAQGALARARARFAETTPPFMPLVDTKMTEAALCGAIAAGAGELDVLIGTTRDECARLLRGEPGDGGPARGCRPRPLRRSRRKSGGNAGVSAAAAGRHADGPARRSRHRSHFRLALAAPRRRDGRTGRPGSRLPVRLGAPGQPVRGVPLHRAAVHLRHAGWFSGPPQCCVAATPLTCRALSATMRDHWGRFLHTGTPGAILASLRRKPEADDAVRRHLCGGRRSLRPGMAHMSGLAHTALGDLQGIVSEGVLSFRNVPYAEPPIGSRRFAPPVPVAPWQGVRDATVHGPVAPQPPSRLRLAMGDFERPQAEDCLTLTIATPATEGARPVVRLAAWRRLRERRRLAGLVRRRDAGARGAMSSWSASITVSARWVFCTIPRSAPAITRCRTWRPRSPGVRDHIAAFGGDPARVTLMGQSAGAHAIMCLLTMPARGAVSSGDPAEHAAPRCCR